MEIAKIKDSKKKIDIGVDGQCDSPGNDLKLQRIHLILLTSFTTLGAETFANLRKIRESLGREKFYYGRFAKVYAREMQKFREFFGSRKFLLPK